MKTPISLCLNVLLLLPLCYAQCPLEISNTELLSALQLTGFIREANETMFSRQDITYLCFVRSTTDNTRFDQVRVSMLYTYDSAMNQSAQATFSVCLNTFQFTVADVDFVTNDTHYTSNMTREDCQDCQDNSPFARPTFCTREF